MSEKPTVFFCPTCEPEGHEVAAADVAYVTCRAQAEREAGEALYAALKEPAALAVPPVPTTGWQPIATAPPNKSVLVCWADKPDWQPEALYRRHDGSWTDNEGETTFRAPTHWMPLPSPPQEPR